MNDKFEILAIPKTSPILTGASARKLINEMQVPKDNSELIPLGFLRLSFDAFVILPSSLHLKQLR